MFWNLLWIENQKSLRRSLLWVELILLLAFVILVFSGLYFAIQDRPDGVTITDADLAKLPDLVTWPGALAFSLRMAAGGKLLLIIFVGAATASEYNWRSYQIWLGRGVPRTLLMGVKFVSFCLPLLLVVASALIAGASISAVFTVLLNGDLSLEQVSFWRLGLDSLRTAYTLLPYAGITFLLAVATRSAVAAIGGCTAYGLIVESFLAQNALLMPGKLGELARYLPANLMQSVLGANWTPPSMLEEVLPGLFTPAQAGVGIAIWTLTTVGIALYLFRHQDLSG